MKVVTNNVSMQSIHTSRRNRMIEEKREFVREKQKFWGKKFIAAKKRREREREKACNLLNWPGFKVESSKYIYRRIYLISICFDKKDRKKERRENDDIGRLQASTPKNRSFSNVFEPIYDDQIGDASWWSLPSPPLNMIASNLDIIIIVIS